MQLAARAPSLRQQRGDRVVSFISAAAAGRGQIAVPTVSGRGQAAPYDSDHMTTHLTLPAALQTLLPKALHDRCTTRDCARGERLFRSGRPPAAMHFVDAGEVALQRVGRGGEQIVLQRVHQGLVAEASLEATRYHCDALVIAPSSVAFIPLPPLRAALLGDGDFATRWITMLNQQLRELRRRCERLCLRTVEARLRHLIETEGTAQGWRPRSNLKSVAHELGVTHEALYRCVAELQRRGALTRGRGASPWWRLHP